MLKNLNPPFASEVVVLRTFQLEPKNSSLMSCTDAPATGVPCRSTTVPITVYAVAADACGTTQNGDMIKHNIKSKAIDLFILRPSDLSD
jgi:hypothetical protein